MASTDHRSENTWPSQRSQDQNETLSDLEREVLDEYVRLRDNLDKVIIFVLFFSLQSPHQLLLGFGLEISRVGMNLHYASSISLVYIKKPPLVHCAYILPS